jgi:nicotinamide riboside kinase
MQKIAIMGVHSAGKTTLAYILSAHFKMMDYNVKLIHESVRENCPFPINAEANQGTCLWNFHTQFLNELEAEAQGYQLAICDRSVLDTFVYFHAVNPVNSVTQAAMEQAAQWLTTYDLLICLEPEEGIALHEDGVRSTDRGYLQLIREGFRRELDAYGEHVKDRLLFYTSRDVFEESHRTQLLKRVGEAVRTEEVCF